MEKANSLSPCRERWLSGIKESARYNAEEISLLERASGVFVNNLIDKKGNAWGDCRGILPSPGQYDGVWNWDSAFHALAVSRMDPALAYEQFEIFFSFQGEDGIFPDVIYANGKCKDNYSKPPVLPWAFVEVYKRCPDATILPRAYAAFVKNLSFWNTCRRDEVSGLYHYDAKNVDDRYWEMHKTWESGMDNSPRWDHGVSRWLCPDLCGYMVLFYDALYEMAKLLGLSGEAEQWAQERELLKYRLNTHLWSEEYNCFADRDRFTGEFSPVLSSAMFVPLFACAADGEKAKRMADNAANPELFFPAMPTVAYNSPLFDAADYWRGPVWLNLAYFAAEGLRRYGYTKHAEQIKAHVLRDALAEKRDIFEYYNARTGEGLGANSFGWSSAFLIEFICGQ